MRAAACIVVGGLAAMSGCVTEGGPRDPGPQPKDVKPQSMSLIVPDFVDTNDNRYRDSTELVVYLQAAGYALPVTADGAFEFRLMDRPGKTTIASWDYPAAETAAAVKRLGPGPGYVFTLNLQEKGGDRLELRDAILRCTFRPAAGEPIRAESTPLLIGKSHIDSGSK